MKKLKQKFKQTLLWSIYLGWPYLTGNRSHLHLPLPGDKVWAYHWRPELQRKKTVTITECQISSFLRIRIWQKSFDWRDEFSSWRWSLNMLWIVSYDQIVPTKTSLLVQTVPTEINIGIKFQFYKSPTKIIMQQKNSHNFAIIASNTCFKEKCVKPDNK